MTKDGKTPALNEDAAALLQMEFTEIVREEIGYKEDFASQIASAVLRGLRRRRGGEELYVPAADRSERDAAIRREFNGTNLLEVCRRHGVSKSTVYRVCEAAGRAQPAA
ncbi:MAG TPA: Mor transcription activator family protein [Ramlibacter sp.]|nr:Mor transcription activator family protein [Ramlibacter sp.]